MTKLEHALTHVRRGWSVFPLPKDSKKPHEGGLGVRSASNSETQIRAWWDADPEANIGGTGFFVLDCDSKPDSNGLDNLHVWCLERGIELPDTLTYRSQGSGEHLIFKTDEPFGQGTGDLPEGVDVRAPGMGYIVLPGSTIGDRAYSVSSDVEIASAPSAIVAQSRKSHREAGPVEIAEGVTLDHPLAVSRAKAYLSDHRLRRVDGMIDWDTDDTYATVNHILDLGVTPRTALGLCGPYYEPKWHSEIETITLNALAYRQNPIGVSAPSQDLLALCEAAQAPEPRQRFRIRPPKDAVAQDASFADLIDDLIPAGEVGAMFAAWGEFKTFSAIYIAGMWSLGRPVFGKQSYDPGAVLYIAAESPISVRMRISAFNRHFGVEANIHVLDEPCRLNSPEDVSALCTQLADMSFRFIIIDTLSKATPGLDDNTKADASLILQACQAIGAAAGGATIMGIAHSGHASKERIRGSSDYPAGFSFMLRSEKIDKRHGKVTVIKTKDSDGEGDEFYLTARDADTGWVKKHQLRSKKSLVLDYDPDGESRTAERENSTLIFELVEILTELGGQGTVSDLSADMGVKSDTLSRTLRRAGGKIRVPPRVGADGVEETPEGVIYQETCAGGRGRSASVRLSYRPEDLAG